VVVNEPTGLSDKVAWENGVAISVALRDGTRVSIGATASASLVTATLRALR
jgi:hypothetical protein